MSPARFALLLSAIVLPSLGQIPAPPKPVAFRFPSPAQAAERLRAISPDYAGLIFTQLPAGQKTGGRLMLLTPKGEIRLLSEGFESAADPSVSFDGKRVLFAGRKSVGDNWNIFEIAADGSGLRQITRDAGNCRTPSYQPAYYVLDGAPWYQITFVSDVSGEWNESEPVPSTSLYSAKLDGTGVRRLTFLPSGSFDPWQMADGRILFSGRTGLFGVHIDGTDYAAFSVEEGRPVKRMACTTPGRLAVFVESARSAVDGSGQLASVSLRRNLHSYRRITTAAAGLFHSPSPLPDGSLLVSRRPASAGTHAIYRADPVTGKLEPLLESAGFHDIQARLIYARGEQDGHSSVVDEKDPNGKLYCLSVFNDLPRGAVKRIRVLEGIPRRGKDDYGSSPLLETRVLGDLPVEEDGSFHLHVPANIPMRLQAIDEHGVAVKSCAWIWVKNHEQRGCIGCHEDGERTPENVFAQALSHPAAELTLPPEMRRTVEYQPDVAPVVAKKCALQACHGGVAAPRLGTRAQLGKAVHPGEARTSPVVKALLKNMPPAGSAPLSEAEKRAIIEWIDMGMGGRK